VPKVKLTEKAVDKLRAPDPSGRQVIHWDVELRGFGVLCSGVTNAKSYIAQRDLPNGRSRRITIAPVRVRTLAQAREEAKDIVYNLARGIDPKAARRGAITLKEALDAYLAKNRDLRERSRTDYRTTIKQHFGSWLDLPLSDITRENVIVMHQAIADAVASGGRYTGHATANGAMRALRAVWNFAAQDILSLGPNPVSLTRQWFPVARRERLVTADQLPAFYAAVIALENPVQRDYILMLLFTGLRRSEAAGLRWDDVDFSARIVRLPAVRTKARRKLDLPMSDYVHDLLVGRRAVGTKFVFPSDSKSGHIEEPKFALALVAKASGIKVSAHDLRRTFATVASNTPNITEFALKGLINHSMGSDVTAGYLISTAEALRESAQLVADRMTTLCGITAPAGNVRKMLRKKIYGGL
jgi:integrase